MPSQEGIFKAAWHRMIFNLTLALWMLIGMMEERDFKLSQRFSLVSKNDSLNHSNILVFKFIIYLSYSPAHVSFLHLLNLLWGLNSISAVFCSRSFRQRDSSSRGQNVKYTFLVFNKSPPWKAKSQTKPNSETTDHPNTVELVQIYNYWSF